MRIIILFFVLLIGNLYTAFGQQKEQGYLFNFAVESESYSYFLEVYHREKKIMAGTVFDNGMMKIPAFSYTIPEGTDKELIVIIDRKWEFRLTLNNPIFNNYAVILDYQTRSSPYDSKRKVKISAEITYHDLATFKKYYYVQSLDQE